MSAMAGVDFEALRRGLQALPRAENVAPGERVAPQEVVAVGEHRAALDPERSLVVGNRGMGKSFWTHALANPEARTLAATALDLPELARTNVLIGFNASERVDPIAPTPSDLLSALLKYKDPDAVWRAVLLRAASGDPAIPATFAELVPWVLRRRRSDRAPPDAR